MKFDSIDKIIKKILENEHRKDALYRFAILQDQIGDLGAYITGDYESKAEETVNYGESFIHIYMLGLIRELDMKEITENSFKSEIELMKPPLYEFVRFEQKIGKFGRFITHDPKENPYARAYGNKMDEEDMYGQALLDFFIIAKEREINLEKGIELALEKIGEQHYKRIESVGEEIIGIIGNKGVLSAEAYVVSKENPLKDYKRGVLVIEHSTIEISNYNLFAIVTDQGGATCHAANIARERQIPCIVGTGNATNNIYHGQMIMVNAKGKIGEKGEIKDFLSERYDINRYNGEIVTSSLRNHEYEKIVKNILVECKNKGKIIGVERKKVEIPTDIHHAIRRQEDFNYIDDLINEDYLIQDKDKLYPTEKLLQNQKIPLNKDF